MANYYGVGLCSQFEVVDKDGLLEAWDKMDTSLELKLETDDQGVTTGYIVSDYDDGDLPCSTWNDENDEITDLDVLHTVVQYTKPNVPITYISAGKEKMRYLSGGAVSYCRNNDGEINWVGISLNDIYEKVAEAAGIAENDISMCEY